MGGSGGFGAAAGGGGTDSDFAMCPGSTNHTPGSRLRPYLIVSEEGDRNWRSWSDTERDERCRFEPASDGTFRCLPVNRTSREFFLDADCNEAVYTPTGWDGCDQLHYLKPMVIPEDGCAPDTGDPLYELGAQAAADEGLFRKSSLGACNPYDADVGPVYRLGSEISPSQFVEAAYADVAEHGRIITVAFSGTDGTRQTAYWHDAQIEAFCLFSLSVDGIWRCVPRSGSVGDYFSDSVCNSALYRLVTDCDREPEPYLTDTFYDGCVERGTPVLRSVFSLGAEYSGPVYSGPAGCAELPPDDTSRYYRADPEPLDILQAAELRIDTSDPGRIKPRYHMTDQGGCWFSGFWDTETDSRCSFQPVGDGQYRCLPYGGYDFFKAFTDDACTQPATYLVLEDCLPSPLPPYLVTTDGQCDERQAEVWEPGETLAASELPPLWELSGTSCVPGTPEDEQYVALIAADPARLEYFVEGEPQVE